MPPKKGKSTSGSQEEEEDQLVTLATVRKLLENQEKSIKTHYEVALQVANDKILKLSATVFELKTSIEYSQADIDQLKETNNEHDDHEVNLRNIEAGLKKLQEKVTYMENQSRRCNLRIDGIAEDPKEDWDSTERKLKATLVEKLNLDEEPEIERAHRTPKKSRWHRPDQTPDNCVQAVRLEAEGLHS